MKDHCGKCGHPFDEENTGYAKGRTRNDGTRCLVRFCRACHRAKNTGGMLVCTACGGNRWISNGRGKAPRCAACNEQRCRARRSDISAQRRRKPAAAPRAKPVSDHAQCEPWGAACCDDCRAIYSEVTLIERSNEATA